MAKQRATLEKKAPTTEARQARTIELWCDTCHAKWVEACLSAWTKCPFLDCKGTLRNYPPPSPPKAPKLAKDTSLPLLEGGGL